MGCDAVTLRGLLPKAPPADSDEPTTEQLQRQNAELKARLARIATQAKIALEEHGTARNKIDQQWALSRFLPVVTKWVHEYEEHFEP